MTWDATDFSVKMIREMPDAVIYADADGRIRFWNAGATRIFGFNESEALGQRLDIIIPEELRDRHWAGFNRTLRTGKTRYGAGEVLAVRAMRKGGTRVSIEFSMTPFRDTAGAMMGVGAVLREASA
jgi:PAS domain S-box-containing protein